MSVIPSIAMITRSRPRPQASTGAFRPSGAVTSGRKMLPVDRIGTEVAADDERLLRWIGMLREPLQGDRRRVGPEDGSLRLLAVPPVPPSRAPRPPAVLVRLRDAIHNPLVRKWDRG